MSDRVTVAGSLSRPALLADFLKASLEVRSDCGFGARAGALSRMSGLSGQSTPEVVGRQARSHCGMRHSAKRPEPTPTRTIVARQARSHCGSRQSGPTNPSRSAETYGHLPTEWCASGSVSGPGVAPSAPRCPIEGAAPVGWVRASWTLHPSESYFLAVSHAGGR